jgi:serine-type D-Ala-D-Ala carboxypeptidase/endopeptidase
MAKIDEIQALINKVTVAGMSVAAAVVDPEWGGTVQYVYSQSNPQLSDGSSLTLSPTTPFEIASVTKTFTSTMYLDRAETFGGKFNDQVTLPLPDSILQMPIASLATYTSGFPSDNTSNFGWYARNSLKELCHWFSTKFPANRPVSEPGTVYSYSNLAFDLLSFGAVACQSVTDDVVGMYTSQLSVMFGHISLNMPNTALYDDSMIPALPLGYTDDSKPFPIPAEPDMYDPVSGAIMDFGSGSLVSTAADMAQWLLWNMGRTGSNPAFALQVQFPSPGVLPYSGVDTNITTYGWFLGQTPPNLTYVWKNGGAEGFTSWIGFQQWSDTSSPSQSGCVVLASGPMADTIGFGIMDILLTGTTTGDVRKGPGRTGPLSRHGVDGER